MTSSPDTPAAINESLDSSRPGASLPTPAVRVRAHYLYLLSQFVGKDRMRHHLQGVHFAPHRDGGVIMAATDGRVLAVAYDAEGVCQEDFILLVPPSIAKRGRADLRLRHAALYRLVLGANDAWIVTDNAEGDLSGTQVETALGEHVIDGTFPNYPAVIPRADQMRPDVGVSLDASLVAKFAFGRKAGAVVNLYPTQTGGLKVRYCPILVDVGRPDFVGVIMGIEAERVLESGLPGWITGQLPSLDQRRPAA